MHELSLASAIVDTVERHAGGRPVRVIALRIGALRQVVPDSLELYVELVGRGTVCEGARLELELVPARLRCCGARVGAAGVPLPGVRRRRRGRRGQRVPGRVDRASRRSACIART